MLLDDFESVQMFQLEVHRQRSIVGTLVFKQGCQCELQVHLSYKKKGEKIRRKLI